MSSLPLVQWSFLQFKKGSKSTKDTTAPTPCFLQSATQIGSKILVYGGCDTNGTPTSGLFLYDSISYGWSCPANATDFQEDHPGPRYGHTATLVELHPPKLMIYGGFVAGGTFEFDTQNVDCAISEDSSTLGSMETMERTFMTNRRKAGKQSKTIEETDDSPYFLSLSTDNWVWSKPLVHGTTDQKPIARAEHSSCKTSSNEVTIFGGWANRPMNDLWSFNFVDMEWKSVSSSGIQPKPRYRHTAEMVGTKMYIFGGSDNGSDVAEGLQNLGVHVLCLETLQWSHPTVTGYDPFPRSGHSSAIIGASTVAIFGGKVNDQCLLNDLVLIDLETMVGTSVNAVESHLPTPIANASLSVIGHRCIVFGGTDAKGVCYNDIRSLEVGYYLSKDDITVGEGASSEYCFKILIIGDAAVGKSSLLTRFSENTFVHAYQSTIGIDFNTRMIRVDRAICKLEIWDTAGQERFSTITANYYRGAQGALLVFDVSRRDSFEHVQSWLDRAMQLGGEDVEPVLVGNKVDLSDEERQVSTAEGEAMAQLMNIPYVETSALNGCNVEGAFVSMTAHIKKSVDRRGLTGITASGLASVGGVEIAAAERKQQRFGCSSCAISF